VQSRRRKKKRSRSKWPGETASYIGSLDVEDGSVVVYLPNLGTQHVFILIVLCFYCSGIFGMESFTVTFAFQNRIQEVKKKLILMKTTA
jgi:hypothetical protein